MPRRRLFRFHEQIEIMKYLDAGISKKDVAVVFNTAQAWINRVIEEQDKEIPDGQVRMWFGFCTKESVDQERAINDAVIKWVKDQNSPVPGKLIKQKKKELTKNWEESESEFNASVNQVRRRRRGALHGNSSRPRRNRNDDEEDLNVDVDDTLAYGNPQYTELDVIHNPTDDADKGLEQLRKAVLVNPSAERHVLESRKWNNNGDGPASIEDSSNSSLDKIKKEENGNNDSLEKQSEERTADLESRGSKEDNHVVSSLKEKIKNLEEQNKNVKCLICLEPYTKPVVSTTCWHVHCEECWLMTMGVKKLCPQCNIIVSPSDLRKIYL